MNNEFDIAIVGMSGRFPGARNVDEFWHNLAEGIESIVRLSDQEILASGVPAGYLSDPNYVKAAPILEEPGGFDAGFFGFSPMEAKSMDPQHRILLELAYEALETAGYDPDRYQGRIGVFTGSALNTYFMDVGLNNRLAENYIPTLIGNDKDFLSTRISYKLNLKGPSITVQTACSTSLVAVHLARQSLLSEETDMALAGGISVRVPHRAGYFFDAGGVVSADGHVRAFDAKANGTVFGSGGGILVLKRLADALADGDDIHAVIKGSAVNNDGSEKAGYTAPSVNSQADAVVEALANAGVDADTISYVEAHGSGTPVGDPIEISALTKAFRTFTQRSGYCAIGSVKTNIGHLDAAAAVAGMIKTVLALKHRKLPPSLHFIEGNPEINFPGTPFYVNTTLRDWTSDGPRRAGVMSTGMGGTNAHVVLEEAPEVAGSTHPPHLLVWSAKTEAALDQGTHRLREFLSRADSVNMSDVAYTLQIGRKAFPHRRCLLCVDREDAVTALREERPKRVLSDRTNESRRPVIFLLPGVGDHYVGMAHELYETWAVFKEEVDRCSNILESHLGIDIRTILYPNGQGWKNGGRRKGIDLKKMLGGQADAPEDQDATNLNRTLFAQPALFTIEYAMARLWHSFGITPDAIVGHSMGEYVAACLAGVMSLDDALRLIATRARLVDELPQGAMLAVALSENELLSLLPDDLSVSLINGPSLCVVAGPVPSVAEFERILTARGAISRHVRNAHAFHSKMLDPIVKAFEAEARKVQLNEPRIPYISNVSGKWIAGREATNAAYWAMHANHTARFSDAIHELWQFENPILLEAGPGRTLGVLAMQHPDRRHAAAPVAVSSIRHHYENQSDVEVLWQTIGKLWIAGTGIKWDHAHTGNRQRRIALPTYPFERQNYWINATSVGARRSLEHRPATDESGVDNWFYVPTWERTPFPREIARESDLEAAYWLIVGDQYGGGACIKSRLHAIRQPVGFVRFGKAFVSTGDGSFELNPAGIEDYLKLFRELEARTRRAINIVHLGSLTRNDGEATPALCAANQDFGFYSLLYMAQAIGELNVSVPIKIGIVSNRMHEVTGEERLDPAMATVLGPCGVIPKEFPNVKCFNIDLPDNQAVDNLSDALIATILSEFAKPSRQVVAYRGRHRWERRYEQVKLPKAVPASTSDLPTGIGRFRHGGVYLITGGTGGIGLSIAKYLAEACEAKIVLTKKAPFPNKSTWRDLSAAADTPEPVRRTLNMLLEIEHLGAEVEVIVAESSDKQQMRRAVEETRARFKTINGVIHAAGIVRDGLIQAKTKEVADSVLAPKVYGAMILFDLFKDASLDFFVLFSSMASVLTPHGQSDYSGANAFLDAFAHFSNTRGKSRTLTINWPGWREVGILANLQVAPGLEGWKDAALDKAIVTPDGLEAFKRAVNSGLTQCIVSPEDLNHSVEQSQSPFESSIYPSPINSDTKFAPHQRSRQDGDQPTNEVETAVAKMWGSVLGIEQLGIYDNFSQVGGHSLLAMQIVSKIRSRYGVNFTLMDFFESPTINQSSAVIQEKIGGVIEHAVHHQTQGLLSPMGQRLFSAARVQQAFYFGPSDRRVFAIYHPSVEDGGQVLTVICPPMFNEYMRSHLALRELAISLSEKGQHVLRLDYRGTGDSSCDLDEVAIADWLEDIALVVREGRKLSGCSEVRLLGVRAGALLACRSASGSEDIERVVLWDPVPSGAEYLQALRRIEGEIIERYLSPSGAELSESSQTYAGYHLSERMVEQFSSLDAAAYWSVPKSKLCVVSTSPEDAFPVPGVQQHLTQFACNWETDLDNLIMPKPVLERLATA